MINSGRVELTSMTPVARTASLLFAAFGACIGAGFVGIPLTIGRLVTAQGPVSSLRLVLLAPVTIGLLIIGSAVYGFVAVLRAATWLQGTTAYVRGALGTRAVDLSTAYVSAGTAMRRASMGRTQTAYETRETVAVWKVPTLEVLDLATGRTVTIQLHRYGSGQLPPYALRALAAAMTYRRGWEDTDREVHQLAQRLLALADRPVF